MVAQRAEAVLIQRRLEPQGAPGGKSACGIVPVLAPSPVGEVRVVVLRFRAVDWTTEVTEGHRAREFRLCALCDLCGYFWAWVGPLRLVGTTESTGRQGRAGLRQCPLRLLWGNSRAWCPGSARIDWTTEITEGHRECVFDCCALGGSWLNVPSEGIRS